MLLWETDNLLREPKNPLSGLEGQCTGGRSNLAALNRFDFYATTEMCTISWSLLLGWYCNFRTSQWRLWRFLATVQSAFETITVRWDEYHYMMWTLRAAKRNGISSKPPRVPLRGTVLLPWRWNSKFLTVSQRSVLYEPLFDYPSEGKEL